MMSPHWKRNFVASTSVISPQRRSLNEFASRCSRPTYRSTPDSEGLSTRSLICLARWSKRHLFSVVGTLGIAHLLSDDAIKHRRQCVHPRPEGRLALVEHRPCLF